MAVARARTVAGYAIPGIIVFFFWVVVAILAIILLAFIVHWAGGGVLNLRLGHFVLNVGFTYGLRPWLRRQPKLEAPMG